MSNLSEQLSTLSNRLDGLQSLATGKQANPTLYAAVGQVVLFGCKVTQGALAADYVIALESQATGDTARLNPDLQSPPLYPFQYGNIASTKAAAFYASDLTTTVELPPTAGTARYDIAYIAVGPTGPVFGMATGTASSAVRDDFIANGLRTSPYDSGTDAALPVGGLAVARIYVEGDVVGIPDTRIADLRSFDGRLKGTAFTYADLTPTQKDELASGAITDVTTLRDQTEVFRDDSAASASTAGNHANTAGEQRSLAETFAATASKKAQEAAQIVSNDAIALIETQFNYASVQKAIYVSNIGPWRTRGRGLSWYDPSKPQVLVGQNTAAQGQYASATAAVNAGGLVGEYFYNTTTKFWEKITATGTPASTRIYAAGQVDFPAEVVIVVVGTGSSTRLIIKDATVSGCPMWVDYRIGQNLNTGIKAVVFSGSSLWIAFGGEGLYQLNYSVDDATLFSASNKRVLSPISSIGDGTFALTVIDSAGTIPSNIVNALATYTAPDAPIDPVSGEPVAYIAGATAGGVFVIKPDGAVIKSADTGAYLFVTFLADRLVSGETVGFNQIRIHGEVSTLSAGFGDGQVFDKSTTPSLNDITMRGVFAQPSELLIAFSGGLNILRPNPNAPAQSLIQKIGSNFNTGPYIDGAGTAAVMCGTDTGSIADTELVTNGTFDSDTVWTKETGWTIAAGVATHASGTASTIYQTLPFVVGQTYKATFTITSRTAGSASIRIGSGAFVPYEYKSAVGTYSVSFTANASSILIGVIADSAFDGSIDNVSIKAVSADFTGNSNHFDVIGTNLTRQAINSLPGAIAAYSGFSAGDYLRSTDADLNVSGKAFTWPILFNTSNTNIQAIICQGEAGVAGKEKLFYLESGTGKVIFNTGANNIALSAGGYNDGKWHAGVLMHTATGGVTIVADAEVVASASYSPGAFVYTDIRVGLRTDDGIPFLGSLAAFVPQTGIAWTEQQAKLWCRVMKTLIDNGSVTQEAAAVAADYITRAGQTLSATATTVSRSTNTSRISNEASTVGTIAAVGAGERGEIVVGGSTGLKVSVPARNLREPDLKLTQRRYPIEYAGNAARVQFPLQTSQAEIKAAAGGKPVKVWNNGVLQTEGAADDYTIKYDGFNYWVLFAVAPGTGAEVIVEFEKEVFA